MSQISRYFRFSLITAIVFVVLGTILACGTAPASEEAVAEIPPPTPTVPPASPTPSPTPILPSSTPTTEPSPTPSPTPVPPSPTPTTEPSPTSSPDMASSDESCVACHTDQDQLIATAKDEEVVEALSEGEG